jgi:hypothetical protein
MGQHPEAELNIGDASLLSSTSTVFRMNPIVGRLGLVAGLVAIAVVVPATLPSSSVVEAASATVTCAPQPLEVVSVAPPMLSYTPINPVRLIDTRNNIGGVAAPLGRGCTMIVNVGSDIPANAQAVALSMTAVNSEADFFTVYPCATGRPETSNLNARAVGATPNLVTAIPDVNRQICVYSHGRSDLIIDLSGWWSDGPNRFASIAPQRVYDSRRPGLVQLAPFRVREVKIPTSVIPDGSTAAVVNLTAANGARPGYMTAFPCGQPAPDASNVNFLAGEARAVGAIVGLGLGSTLCVLADTSVHVIVDVTGFYAPAPAFGPTAVVEPTAGRRVVDTRNGTGGPLLPLAANEIRSFDPVVGLANAADASAVMLNFVSTDAGGDGFLTAFPCGGAVPDVSTLNYVRGEAATNLATIELGVDRRVCIVSSVQTNVIVDVFGVMTAPAGSPVERLSFDTPTWPPFDPAATDYVVECAAGAGSSNVTMTIDLLPFTTATVKVSGGPAIPVSTGTATVSMRTDDLLLLSTVRQGVVKDYHFRCVPTDFPRLDVTRPGNPAPGWYLTTSGFVSPNPARNGPYLMILDSYGAPVWYKRTPSAMMDAKRLSDGRLTFTPSNGPYGIEENQGYWLTNLEGTGTIKHRTTNPLPAELPTDHHDYLELPGIPNGRAMVSYPIVPNVDLSAMVPPPAPGNGAPGTVNDTIADGVIQEVDGNGNELWRWDMSDYFDPASSTFAINFDTNLPRPPAGTGAAGFPDAWDVFHINAIDREPDGDYIVTVRHMDGVFRVDRGSGNVEWTLGTPPANNPRLPGPAGPQAPQLTIVGDPFGGPKRPHDARLNGNVLTMLDNQAGTGRPSRAVAYTIDTTNLTATLLWEFRNAATGGATLGSAQQVDGGSVVVNWGAGLQPFLEELAPNGDRLMSVRLPFGGNSYRTVKYAPADFEVNTLRATAGGSVASPPP